jgi:ribonuclease J
MGNIEDMVLRDRKVLSNNGIVFIAMGIDINKRKIVMEPDFTMRGIILIDNLGNILEDGRKIIKDSLEHCFENNILEKNRIEDHITDKLEKFIFKKARIRPIITLKVMISK